MVKALSDGGPTGVPQVISAGLLEIISHPFGNGNLTSNGVQYSAPATSGTAENVYATVQRATVCPLIEGEVEEANLALTAAIRSDGTAGNISWQWQGKHLEETDWVNLHPVDSTVSPGTAYFEDTKSGYFNKQAKFNEVPFEIQLLVKSNKVSDGVAKTKNSSYADVIFNSLKR